MEHRKLGRTGLKVSVIGPGTEYLNKQPRETVVAVIREAIERGVNYIDLVFSFPNYLDNLSVALRGGYRERALLTAHLGSTEKNGQYHKTRSSKRSEVFFLDLLSRLGTDHVDVLFLHNFNSSKDLARVLAPGGLMDLAQSLRQEGKARFVGLSAHTIEVATRAVESGQVDVLMFPVNLAGNAMPGRKELLSLCARRGVGLVAMKPFGGGKLLQQRRTVRVGKYQTGGQVNRLVDAVQQTVTAQLQTAYDALAVKASACTECGACVERCPFGVDVVSTTRQAVRLFESSGRYEN